MTRLDPRNSREWDVQESKYTGEWTRTSGEGEDVQHFKHYAGDEMKVHYAGDHVYVERYKPGDLHYYHGTVSEDGRTVDGKYLIANWDGEKTWSAQLHY
ncbi:MAG: hypothetical protein SX243_08295 [Acidobacteriota bacterium]|nr:hypothetical protein [Acidobacteriota bacterium]